MELRVWMYNPKVVTAKEVAGCLFNKCGDSDIFPVLRVLRYQCVSHTELKPGNLMKLCCCLHVFTAASPDAVLVIDICVIAESDRQLVVFCLLVYVACTITCDTLQSAHPPMSWHVSEPLNT